MKQDNFKVYSYRWIVLVAFMFIVAITQLLWITFAPITGDASKFYGVPDLSIGLLSMSFMIVYIVVSIPDGYSIQLVFPFFQVDPIPLRPQVRVPYGGT